jgi:site-specific DNA-cytosine methylase
LVSIAACSGRNEHRGIDVKKKIACVDLFCGAGGLTHGFILEGLPVVAGIDLDPACRFPYETNNGKPIQPISIKARSSTSSKTS